MSKVNPWNEVARLYDETRPAYPDQLINDMISGAGLSSHSRLLEIGAGSGKATVMLAERGFRVHCVEPGQNLVDILLQKCSMYSGVSVDVARFEDWLPTQKAKFDLVYSAQAFNWIEPDIRYRKSHELLKEGGYLALFWYQPSSPNPQLEEEINSVISLHVPEHAQGRDAGRAANGMVVSWESDIVASGLFQSPQVFEYHAEDSMAAEAYVRTVRSCSWFALLDNDLQTRICDEIKNVISHHGGYVTSDLNYKMYLARRTTNA